jgi:hypothetical protein
MSAMKTPRFFVVFGACVAMLAAAGCGTFAINPVTDESRLTYPVKDESMFIEVKTGMTFNDAKIRTYSIFVPAGIYKLEARDDDYLYFVTTGVVTRSVYDGKAMVDQSVCQGGIMLGRKEHMLVPAGVYKNDGSMNRVMIWKLNDAFMKLNGAKWALHQPRA